MISTSQFRAEVERFRRCRPGYARDFDVFWTWKTEVEARSSHVLDHDRVREAYDRLHRTLPGWKYARGSGNSRLWLTLEDSLARISDTYDEIRGYSLLDLGRVPQEALAHIWHDLGRVKEPNGDMNPTGRYLVISICKPLMLLWGQTMAFDSNMRGALPTRYGVTVTDRRWPFGKWMRVMEGLWPELEENPELADLIRTIS